MIHSELRVSVVICAYTEARWEQLVASAGSVLGQSRPPLELIIAIDHNPALLERARTCLPGAIVVANSREKGLSGARNSGLAIAEGDIVAFLDDDAVAAPDWLERICAGYRDDRVIGVGGAIDPAWVGGRRPSWFPREFGWVVGCSYQGMPRNLSQVRNLIGANMSFRRDLLIQLGGFRSGMGRVGTFPAGCEETELCIRAHRHWPGGTLLYDPDARVDHCVPPSRAGFSYFRSRCYAEGLSKALVSKSVGPGDGLSSERAYVSRTLPVGVLRGAMELLRGDAAGAGRACAIVSGLTLTALGYLVGLVKGKLQPMPSTHGLFAEPQRS